MNTILSIITARFNAVLEAEGLASDFDATGELRGISEVVDLEYKAGDGRYFAPSSEGLTDTTELSDDNYEECSYWEYDEDGEWVEESTQTGGRWAHIADSHVREEWLSSRETGWASNPLPAHLKFLGDMRRELAERLARWLKSASEVQARSLKAVLPQRVKERKAQLLGVKLPKAGAWPGVSGGAQGLHRTYQDGDLTVRFFPAWSEVYLSKQQLTELLSAADNRIAELRTPPQPGRNMHLVQKRRRA